MSAHSAVLIHGTNANCPQCRSGEWKHCKGHDVPSEITTLRAQRDELAAEKSRLVQTIERYIGDAAQIAAVRDELAAALRDMTGAFGGSQAWWEETGLWMHEGTGRTKREICEVILAQARAALAKLDGGK